MGQLLSRSFSYGIDENDKKLVKFQDLTTLPPELSLTILSYLNATDLCLAGCVWRELAHDDMLWKCLCINTWPYCSAYRQCIVGHMSFRRTYLLLDEGCLTFNADCFEGMQYLFKYGLVVNEPYEIAKFFHFSQQLNPSQKQRYIETRQEILDKLMELKNYSNQFLANALRKFFSEISAPKARDHFLSRVLERFSHKFVECNPTLSLSEDEVFLLCYSLIMLSVDLCSPHVKNKMSKREFIRNTRQATRLTDDDFLGDLYDNVYLLGHVASLTS